MTTASSLCNSTLTDAPFSKRLGKALLDLRVGVPVVLVDDFNRENEADLILAAEKLSVPAMAMLIRECSGIVCLCLTHELANHLQLPPMVPNNRSRFLTAFTVSIEAADGVTTGVSAQDRVVTIQRAVADGAQPGELVSPGHVFPLRAAPGGVLQRQGHTEGSIELAVMAGLKPAAVLCELTNADGTMAKGQQIADFAAQHNLTILSIEELVRHRMDELQLLTEFGRRGPACVDIQAVGLD